MEQPFLRNGVRMNVNFARGFLAISIVGFFTGIAGADDSSAQLGAEVSVRRLAPNIWVHTSIQRYPGGVLIPSNGLIDETDHGSILIDTAWNDEQTQRIC